MSSESLPFIVALFMLIFIYMIFSWLNNRAWSRDIDRIVKELREKGMEDLAKQFERARPHGLFRGFRDMFQILRKSPLRVKIVLLGCFLLITVAYAFRIWQASN